MTGERQREQQRGHEKTGADERETTKEPAVHHGNGDTLRQERTFEKREAARRPGWDGRGGPDKKEDPDCALAQSGS